MTSASVEAWLNILDVLLLIVLFVRLVLLRFYHTYPFFCAFVTIPLVTQSIAVIFGTSSGQYFWAYCILEPIRDIIYVLVVWELFSVVFRNYAGLRSLSRWVMGIAAAIAPVGLILTSLAAGSKLYNASEYVRTLARYERGIALGLVIFILIMLFFISRYPIKLPRNSVALCMTYTVWFLGLSTLLVLLSYLSKEYRFAVNIGLTALEIGSCIGWIAALSETGEYQETRVRRDMSPEHEQALIGELNAMNELLLRAGRSISRTH